MLLSIDFFLWSLFFTEHILGKLEVMVKLLIVIDGLEIELEEERESVK